MSGSLKKDDPYLKKCAKQLQDFMGSVCCHIGDQEFITGNLPVIEHSLKELLKFSSMHIRHFPKSSQSALHLCKSLLFLKVGQFLELSSKHYSQILCVCLSIVVFHKNEMIIRESCIILIDFLKHRLDKGLLASIVQKYFRTLPLILRKVAHVQTYLTQSFIMEIFFRLTQTIEDKRLGFLKEQSFYARIQTEEEEKVATNHFFEINVETVFKSSRKFITYLNHELVNKDISIFTFGCGSIIAVNESFTIQEGQIILDFNAAQKCLSFVTEMKSIFNFLPKSNENPSVTKGFAYFELSYEKIEASCHDIDEITVIMMLRDAMFSTGLQKPLKRIAGLETICFQIMEKDMKVYKAFMEDFYPNILLKAPLNNIIQEINESFVGNESIVSLQTAASFTHKFATTGKENAEIKETVKNVNDTLMMNDLNQSQNPAVEPLKSNNFNFAIDSSGSKHNNLFEEKSSLKDLHVLSKNQEKQEDSLSFEITQALQSVMLSEKTQDAIETIDYVSSNDDVQEKTKVKMESVVEPTRKSARKSLEQKNASVYDMEPDDESLPPYKVFVGKIRQQRIKIADKHEMKAPVEKLLDLRLTSLVSSTESDGDDKIYEECSKKLENKKGTASRKRNMQKPEIKKTKAKPKKQKATKNNNTCAIVVDALLTSVEGNDLEQSPKKKSNTMLNKSNNAEVSLNNNTTFKVSELEAPEIYRYLMQGTHELGLIPIN